MTFPTPFEPGYRLTDGDNLNDQFANPVWSLSETFTAKVGGSASTSPLLVNTITNVTTAAAPNAGILLPQALPGQVLLVANTSGNPITVFADGGSTINGLPGNIGFTQETGDSSFYLAVAVKAWYKLDFLPVGFPKSFIEILLDINALRAWSNTSSSSPAIIALVKNYVANDGGGLFWIDVTDNTSPDNGTTIIVDAVGNRWKRELVQAQYIASATTRAITATNVQDAITQLAPIANIAALRGLSVSGSLLVTVEGYYTAGDGGGGDFYAVTTGGPFTDNGGTIIVPGGGTGPAAWKRVNTGLVSVKFFGAVGDNVTDDSAAFQSAINNFGIVYVPSGTYYVHDLTVPNIQNFRAGFVGVPADVLYITPGLEQSIIDTQGNNLIQAGSASVQFVCSYMFFKSTGQTGTAFSSTSAYETNFVFTYCYFIDFEYACYSPNFSSGAYFNRVNITQCEYGIYLTNAANRSAFLQLDLLFCAIGLSVIGTDVQINGVQIGMGYTGNNASAHPFFAGMQLRPWQMSVSNVYAEPYGNDVSKVVLYDIIGDVFNNNSLVFMNAAMLGTVPSLAALQADLQISCAQGNVTQSFDMRLINCPTPKIIAKAGYTGAFDGIYMDDGYSIYNQFCIVPRRYNVEVAFSAGQVTGIDFLPINSNPLIQIAFSRSSIVNENLYINWAGGGPFTDIYSASDQTFNIAQVVTPVTLEFEFRLPGLASAGPYAIGVYYADAVGFKLVTVGTFYAFDGTGGTFDLNISGTATVPMIYGQHVIFIGFITGTAFISPTLSEIATSLSGRIRVLTAYDR